MTTAAQVLDQDDCFVQTPGVSVMEAWQHDTYWERAFWQERYYNPQLEYEDYAPAYCVGYIGHAQYGGEFDDSERSLCANWERIKGGSRLSLDDALLAMRAAWKRHATRGVGPHAEVCADADAAVDASMLRSLGMPSLELVQSSVLR